MVSTIRASTILALYLVEFSDKEMDKIRRQSMEAISKKDKVMKYLFEVLGKASLIEHLSQDETRERLRHLLSRVPYHVVDQFVAHLREIWEQIEADPFRDMKVLRILENISQEFVAKEYDGQWPQLFDYFCSYGKSSQGDRHKKGGYML